MTVLRFDLARASAKDMTKNLNSALADMGGAKSPELIESAKILARSLRKVLSLSGGGARRGRGATRSRPGEPPRKQTGGLAKSVAQGVVGAGRRVAVLNFKAMLEEGVDTAREPNKNARGKVRLRRGAFSGGIHAKRRLVIAARPFMEKALNAVKDEMVGTVVTLGETRALQAGA